MIIKKFFAVAAVVAGVVASAAGVAAAASHPASVTRHASATQHRAAARASGEDPSHEADGPGGHQDPNGQNVNHQFQGVE